MNGGNTKLKLNIFIMPCKYSYIKEAATSFPNIKGRLKKSGFIMLQNETAPRYMPFVKDIYNG
jgi:hypothetical protein